MGTVELYISFCRWAGKTFPSFGKGKKLKSEHVSALDFLGWPITHEEFSAAQVASMLVGMGAILLLVFIFLILFMLGFVSADDILVAGAMMIGVFGILIGMLLFRQFPFSMIEHEKMQSLAYTPEIVNYMAMNMRLTGNLERAVQFAAEHGRGKIAEDFKKLIWDTQIGVVQSIEEGLDNLAYRWGDYSDDFKHALMLIRSSVLESNEEKRIEVLEKAVSDVLEGSREKMDLYARQMHQPAVYLYYFGILLPLMMAIMLPIGGMFTGMALGKTEYLIAIYNILLPIVVFTYGSSILGGRPPTNVPPTIPDDYPGLTPKGKINFRGMLLPIVPIAIAILILFSAIGYLYEQFKTTSIPSYVDIEKIDFTPYVWILSTLIGLGFSISFYLWATYKEKKKIQDEIRSMEGEFKDAMYILASRLGEGRPMESALRHAVDFLPKSKLANVTFVKIIDNVNTMGMDIRMAIFDPTFGALKNMPSQLIRGGMKIMVDAVELGVNVAAKSLISVAVQIRDSQKLDEMLKKLLEDVTMMLKTMSTFVAPIVLGIVGAMQRLISSSISGLATPEAETAGPGVSMTGFGDTSQIMNIFSQSGAVAQSATPGEFMAIMGLYVIQITMLLTYINSQIEDGNNLLHAYLSISSALPVAIVFYAIVAYLSGTMFSGMT